MTRFVLAQRENGRGKVRGGHSRRLLGATDNRALASRKTIKKCIYHDKHPNRPAWRRGGVAAGQRDGRLIPVVENTGGKRQQGAHAGEAEAYPEQPPLIAPATQETGRPWKAGKETGVPGTCDTNGITWCPAPAPLAALTPDPGPSAAALPAVAGPTRLAMRAAPLLTPRL